MDLSEPLRPPLLKSRTLISAQQDGNLAHMMRSYASLVLSVEGSEKLTLTVEAETAKLSLSRLTPSLVMDKTGLWQHKAESSRSLR